AKTKKVTVVSRLYAPEVGAAAFRLKALVDGLVDAGARVNVVTEVLFSQYPSPAALAAATADEIEAIVKPCGLGHTKARDIHLCMNELMDLYGGNVPDDFDKILALPGVGRKSANLILGDVFGKPAIVTDTHCIRLCNRMGLTKNKEPKKVEMDLWKIIPPAEGRDFCHRLVFHGRAVCNARTPHCEECCVKELCAFYQKEHKAAAAEHALCK
ncbi:MAG: endonuclease III, partial [Pygmaiobacter sp.]